MNSSRPPAEPGPPAGTAVVLVAEGGVVGQMSVPEDPYAALDDLMAVLEVLCPKWPERSVVPATDLRL